MATLVVEVIWKFPDLQYCLCCDIFKGVRMFLVQFINIITYSNTMNTYWSFYFVCFFKVCHSKSGEVDSAKVANLVKAYVDKYKHSRKKGPDDKFWATDHHHWGHTKDCDSNCQSAISVSWQNCTQLWLKSGFDTIIISMYDWLHLDLPFWCFHPKVYLMNFCFY